jgi:hypothetical protein
LYLKIIVPSGPLLSSSYILLLLQLLSFPNQSLLLT